jgi:hypothetical protein
MNLESKLVNKKPTGTAMIPLHHTISNKIITLLKKHTIRTVQIPKKKTAQMLRSAKGGLEHRVPGVYRIPCECGKVYVGQSGRTVEARYQEHQRYISVHQPEKSAVAEHVNERKSRKKYTRYLTPPPHQTFCLCHHL